jgi:hypothetical protein
MPPKKSSSSGSGRNKAEDPLRLEKKRLLEEQEKLIREQERARRLIEEAPRRLEQLKRKQREPIKIHLSTARAGQKTFGMPHDKFRDDASTPRRPRLRKADRNIAKLQFVVFVVILAVILFMVWRAVPTSM